MPHRALLAENGVRPVRRRAFRRVAALAALSCLALACLTTAACAPSDPPPTSPLDERPAGPAVDGTPRPLPTFPATPTGTLQPAPDGSPITNAAAQAEKVTGEAIARLAGWTGFPESEFRLTAIEAVEWPDACLGVRNPAVACAEVITPGYRVKLHHVSAPAVPLLVHASKDGRYAWAPTRGPLARTLASVDASAGRLGVLPEGGNDDPIGLWLRVTPGSTLEAPLAALAPGQRVLVGVAGPLQAEADALVVLLVPIAE